MSDDYRPIDCALYSEYELAIMHRTRLRVHWREDGQDHVATLLPKDLRTTAAKEEFLIAEDCEGQPQQIRLDHIVKTMPLEGEPA